MASTSLPRSCSTTSTGAVHETRLSGSAQISIDSGSSSNGSVGASFTSLSQDTSPSTTYDASIRPAGGSWSLPEQAASSRTIAITAAAANPRPRMSRACGPPELGGRHVTES